VLVVGEVTLPAERRRLSICDMPKPPVPVVGVVVAEGEGWMEAVTIAGRLRRW
jgi:hypothetical protein